MKRIGKALLLCALTAVLFAGCAAKTKEMPDAAEAKTEENVDATSQASATMDESGLYKLPTIESKSEKEIEQSYDVVVVGAGGAGFSAAISAASKGASVVILEQENVVGGNTSYSGAGLDIPGTGFRKLRGSKTARSFIKKIH